MAVTDKERKLAATLSDPVLWGQAYLYNRDGSGRDYWPHQVEDLRCPAKNIIHLDGRDVGKSIVLSTDALHYAFTTPAGIGVDNGGNGLAVVQELLTLDKYKGLELEGRLKGYDFGGMTRLAVRDGKEIKKRTKELMTSLINGALQRKQVIFPSDDLELEDQFTTHTYTLRDGKIIYSKGNDHIIDAVRCAMLIREEGNLDPVGEEVVSLKPVLTNPVFI